MRASVAFGIVLLGFLLVSAVMVPISAGSKNVVATIPAIAENENVLFDISENENTFAIAVKIAPTADFTYSPANPGIDEPVTFNAENSYVLNGTIDLYEWDWENDGTYDATGKILTHSFSAEGDYPINLRVTDNTGATDNTTKIVSVAKLRSQYDGFFLTGIPIHNTYTFSDPENPPDGVDFIMIAENGKKIPPKDDWVTDDNEWKARFDMGEFKPNPTLEVIVYHGSSENELSENVTILETPEWLKTLVSSAPYVSYENKIIGNNRYWVIKAETGPITTVGARFNALVDYIGGIYSLNTPAVSAQLEISSDAEADWVITFLDIEIEDAVSVKIPYGKAEAKYRLEIVGQVRVRESDIIWEYGHFDVGGKAGAEFDIRVRVIPFIVEAGVRGGIWANASFRFILVPSEGGDEWLLLPSIAADGVENMEVGANASLYVEVLCGVAGAEGGLEGEGGMTIQLPEENSVFFLKYKLWARAWVLFWSHRWEKTRSWSSRPEEVPTTVLIASEDLPSRLRYENVENFEVSLETLKNTGMKLLVEKPYPFPAPSAAINQRGGGIIVWTDENRQKDPCQAFEIFYSYYDPDDGDWTGAEAITSDEFMDFDSVAMSLEDGRMMAVWNRSSEVLSTDADIKQALGRSKLAYSIWDPSARTWSEPELMTNDKCFGTGKTLTRIGDEVLLTYVLDADNDPFTLERNSLWCMTWDGSMWSEPERLAENLTIISVPRLAMVGENNGGLVFLNDGDDNLRTLEDRTISLIRFADGGWGGIKTVRVGGEINDPWVAAIDNQLYLTWIEETAQEDNSELDRIYISEIDLGRAEISPPRVVMENTLIGRQQLLTDGKRLLLVYQTGENNTPYLLKHEEEIWKQEGGLAYNGRYTQLSVDASDGRLVTTAVRPIVLENRLARSDLYVSMVEGFGELENIEVTPQENYIAIENVKVVPSENYITIENIRWGELMRDENWSIQVKHENFVITIENVNIEPAWVKVPSTLKVIPSIETNAPITVDIGDIAVTKMEISVTNDVENIQIAIQQVGEKMGNITVSPTGHVYCYINFTTNIEPSIDFICFEFKVDRSWILDDNIDESTITLFRFVNGTWGPLSTEKVDEDADYLYFSAESPGLSVFAITGSKVKPFPWALLTTAIMVLIIAIATIGIWYRK